MEAANDRWDEEGDWTVLRSEVTRKIIVVNVPVNLLNIFLGVVGSAQMIPQDWILIEKATPGKAEVVAKAAKEMLGYPIEISHISQMTKREADRLSKIGKAPLN